jgi:hypothetical protein
MVFSTDLMTEETWLTNWLPMLLTSPEETGSPVEATGGKMFIDNRERKRHFL